MQQPSHEQTSEITVRLRAGEIVLATATDPWRVGNERERGKRVQTRKNPEESEQDRVVVVTEKQA